MKTIYRLEDKTASHSGSYIDEDGKNVHLPENAAEFATREAAQARAKELDSEEDWAVVTEKEVFPTEAELLKEFEDVDIESFRLCDLPDSDFQFGGRVDNILRGFGFDESAKVTIGNWQGWRMTVRDLIDHLVG